MIGRVGQVGDVDGDEVGVAEVAGPIGEAVLERLDQRVLVGRAAPPPVDRQVGDLREPRPQDADRLDSAMPPDDGGRHRVDRQPPVHRRHRLALDGGVGDQIVGSITPPAFFTAATISAAIAPCRRRRRHPPSACRACQASSGASRVALWARAVPAIWAANFSSGSACLAASATTAAEIARQPPRHREAARRPASAPARRSGGTGACPSAAPSRQGRAPRPAPPRPARPEPTRRLELAVLEVERWRDRRRRALAEIERVRLLGLGQIDDGKAAAADAGRFGVDDPQRQRGRAGGVDRVAARLQGRDARRRGERVVEATAAWAHAAEPSALRSRRREPAAGARAADTAQRAVSGARHRRERGQKGRPPP